MCSYLPIFTSFNRTKGMAFPFPSPLTLFGYWTRWTSLCSTCALKNEWDSYLRFY